MDKGTTDSHDNKKPHVSFVENGREKYSHVYLSQINDLAGNDADEKDAIRWLRDNKSQLERQYSELNS